MGVAEDKEKRTFSILANICKSDRLFSLICIKKKEVLINKNERVIEQFKE